MRESVRESQHNEKDILCTHTLQTSMHFFFSPPHWKTNKGGSEWIEEELNHILFCVQAGGSSLGNHNQHTTTYISVTAAHTAHTQALYKYQTNCTT